MDSVKRKRCYKELIERGSLLHKGISTAGATNSISISEVAHLISESDKLNSLTTPNDHVNNTAEVVMDAQVLTMEHELLGEIVNQLCSSEFNTAEYCTGIHSKLGGHNVRNWISFANFISPNFSSHKSSPCLLGSFRIEPPIIVEKQAKARQPKSSQAKLIVPESVDKLSEESQGAQKIRKALDKIYKLYSQNKCQMIPYYKLIIDPSDFAQTIDNAFQVAFLVSNRSITIEEDESGFPVVKPLAQGEDSKSSRNQIQAVSGITMEICEEMVNRYNIREPLLP